ncbi:hypothetical protein RchiOBHm_Chr3g0479051 [Rosa chinensis]|uniref:Uncharacterized protein n=1 Tax=Rosa chinensis TaxID=74649 RepID=A0A2P6RDC5_ROSCH|nr:hypothetical protein RchiOBHm_Chr3g0479051 [Rosa chinensis]
MLFVQDERSLHTRKITSDVRIDRILVAPGVMVGLLEVNFGFLQDFGLSIYKGGYAEFFFGKSPLEVGPAWPLRVPGWNSGWVLSVYV